MMQTRNTEIFQVIFQIIIYFPLLAAQSVAVTLLYEYI